MEDPDQYGRAEATREAQAFTDDDLATSVSGLAQAADGRHEMQGMGPVFRDREANVL